MTGTGEVHARPGSLRCRYDFLVAHGSSRLDDGTHPRGEEHLESVGEGEERVRGRYRAAGTILTRPRHGEAGGIDAIDLSHADADSSTVLGEQDRIGLRCAD